MPRDKDIFAAITSKPEGPSFTDGINLQIQIFKERHPNMSMGEISDGYHSFNELYDHRAKLFATIVNCEKWNHLAWKSKQHEDGSMFDGMFIVGINTPEGPASYHYDIDPYWDMFHCEELPQAPHYDGYSDEESVQRIMSLN